MLGNDNGSVAFNSFKDVPLIPYKIITFLLSSDSEYAEMLWKLLKYSDADCLDFPNLTYQEKQDMVWSPKKSNWEQEEMFQVFLKPQMTNSTGTDVEMNTLRIFRYMTQPDTRTTATLAYEFDIITSDKSCMVYYNGAMVEKTDLLESCVLEVLNGRDIGIGVNYLRYDRQLSRSCGSMANISNSKSFMGRVIIMALTYASMDLGGGCSVGYN